MRFQAIDRNLGQHLSQIVGGHQTDRIAPTGMRITVIPLPHGPLRPLVRGADRH